MARPGAKWAVSASLLVCVGLLGACSTDHATARHVSGPSAVTFVATPDGSPSAASPPITADDTTESADGPVEVPGTNEAVGADAPTAATREAARCLVPTGPHEIRVWHILGGYTGPGSFDSLVEEFNAGHPATPMVTESVENGYGGLLDRLNATDRSEWPDVVIAPPAALKRLADSAAMIPPSECATVLPGPQADLLPVIRATYSIGGVQQAVPFGVSTPVLMYDASEVRRAGLDPSDPPKTLDELAADSAVVVASGVSPFGLVVYDWYAGFLINQGAAQRGDLIAEPDNGRSGGPMTVDYDTPENRAALQWIVDVVDTGGGVWIGGNQSIDDLARILTDAVYSIHTSGSIGDVLALADAGSLVSVHDGVAVPVEVGVGPMPGPAPGGLVGGNGMWLVDHGDARRAGAAWTAMDWLTRPANLARFDIATGYIPTSEATAHDPAIVAAWDRHPQLKVGYDQLMAANGDDSSAGVLFGPSTEIESLFFDVTRAIVERGVSPQQALDEVTTTARDRIDLYQTVTGTGSSADG